jgi:hypothetical protein
VKGNHKNYRVVLVMKKVIKVKKRVILIIGNKKFITTFAKLIKKRKILINKKRKI